MCNMFTIHYEKSRKECNVIRTNDRLDIFAGCIDVKQLVGTEGIRY